MTDRDLLELAIAWTHTGDAEIPYAAEVDGRRYTIRINDFPAEPLYTLLADGAELVDLEDWPPAWQMPEPPRALLVALAETAIPRCRGAIRLVARSRAGEPVEALDLADDEVVVGEGRRLDARTLAERGARPHHPPERPTLALEGGDDERVLVVAPERRLAVSAWSTAGGDEVRLHPLRSATRRVLAVHQPRTVAAAIAPDGRSVLVWNEEGGVLRYDLAGGGAPATTRAHRPAPGRPAFLGIGDDTRVWIAASGPTLEVRRARAVTPLATVDLAPLADEVRSLLVVPDDDELLVGTSRGLVLRFALTVDRVGSSPEARLAAIVDAADAAFAGTRWIGTEPRVEVYDQRTVGPRLVQYFVADDHQVHQAQSGSDWVEHGFCSGHAVFDGERCVEVEVLNVVRTRLGELDAEGYDADAAFAAHRAAVARSRSSRTVVRGADAIREAFDAHFGADRILFPERALHQRAGRFSAGGWDVSYQFGTERGVDFADVLLSHRLTNDRLHRVRADGVIELVAATTEGVLPDVDRAFAEEVARRFGR